MDAEIAYKTTSVSFGIACVVVHHVRRNSVYAQK